MNLSAMLDEYPMVVNHFKGKIQRIRAEKKAKGLSETLTREDVQPVLDEALRYIQANVPAGIKKPKDMDGLINQVVNSGIGEKFGLTKEEVQMIGATAKERVEAVPMPMPNERPTYVQKPMAKSTSPIVGQMR
jgi:hypothetical protein